VNRLSDGIADSLFFVLAVKFKIVVKRYVIGLLDA